MIDITEIVLKVALNTITQSLVFNSKQLMTYFFWSPKKAINLDIKSDRIINYVFPPKSNGA